MRERERNVPHTFEYQNFLAHIYAIFHYQQRTKKHTAYRTPVQSTQTRYCLHLTREQENSIFSTIHSIFLQNLFKNFPSAQCNRYGDTIVK